MMRATLLAASTAVILSLSAAAQTPASVTYYGVGCRDFGQTAQAPVMQVLGMPQPGQTVQLRYIGPNGAGINGFPLSIPVSITGLSQVSLPVPRLTIDMSASCLLLVNPDVAVYVMPPNAGSYLDRWSYTIPNTPAVLGAELFHQWATIVLQSTSIPNLRYVMFSNGAKVHVGV